MFFASRGGMDGAQIRTIQRALHLLQGSKPQLAEKLAIPIDDLEGILRGEKRMPNKVFLDALDIVAGTNGRLTPR